MDFPSYLIYLSISVVASISIGPSVMLAANNGLNFGRRKALSGVLGHVSAILVLSLCSASGLGAILLASKATFLTIKYIGIIYLIYIGIAIWKNKGSWAFQTDTKNIPSGFSLYRKSLLLGLSNPKALIFFTALFPQFINPHHDLLPQFLLLAGTSLINAFAFTFGYAFIAHRFKNKLLPIINNGWLARISGSLFFGFATLLAVAR